MESELKRDGDLLAFSKRGRKREKIGGSFRKERHWGKREEL